MLDQSLFDVDAERAVLACLLAGCLAPALRREDFGPRHVAVYDAIIAAGTPEATRSLLAEDPDGLAVLDALPPFAPETFDEQVARVGDLGRVRAVAAATDELAAVPAAEDRAPVPLADVIPIDRARRPRR